MIDLPAIAAELLGRIGVPFRRLSVIELNRSDERGALAALMLFVDDGAAPTVFLKATSDPSRMPPLRTEFETLSELERRGSPALLNAVPRPLFLGEIGRVAVLAETARGGTRMKDLPPGRYFASRAFQRDFASTVGWLAELHRCFADGAPVWNPEQRATAEIARFRERFARSAALDALLDETPQRLAATKLPRPPLHGDFCSANLLVRGDEPPFVIDWEYPLERAWPLADLLYLAASIWCTPYAKGRDALARNFRALFFERHRLTGLLQESVGGYCRDLGVGRETILPLSAIVWVAYANRKLDELLAAGPAPPDDLRRLRHVPLVMFEGERCLNLEMLAAGRVDYVLD